MDKARVMVIDDEEDFCKIIKLNLEETGKFEVLFLLEAREIIKQLQIFKPNIILLDMLMPAVGGLEACEMLNNDPIGQRVPIIILSALDKDSDKSLAFRRGVVDYLIKPIEKDVLITRIEKALKAKQL